MIRRDIAVIAASEGGLEVLCKLASLLDTSYQGSLLVALHVASSSPRVAAEIIKRHTQLPVIYGRTGEYVRPNHIYVAPPGHHLMVAPQGYLRLDDGPKVNHVRPAADPLFSSAAACFGERVAGVVLTGCDGDGTAGLRSIKKAGGVSIVQHPAEAQAPQMPMSALNGDSPDWSVSIEELATLLGALASGEEIDRF